MAKQTSKKQTAAEAVGIAAGTTVAGRRTAESLGTKYQGAIRREALKKAHQRGVVTKEISDEYLKGLTTGTRIKNVGKITAAGLGAAAGGAYYYRKVNGKQQRVHKGRQASSHMHRSMQP